MALILAKASEHIDAGDMVAVTIDRKTRETTVRKAQQWDLDQSRSRRRTHGKKSQL